MPNLPEPSVDIQYTLEYMIPANSKVDPGDHQVGYWYSHALAPGRGLESADPPRIEQAVKAALAEFRQIVPYMEWRAVKHEIVQQVMDW
jgi:hypothetical protein